MTWQGKSRGGVIGHKIFVFILNFFGLKIAYFVLRLVVLYFIIFAGSASYNTYLFFRKRLLQSRLKSIVNVFKNYYIFGTTLLDKTVMFSKNKRTNFTFDFEGEEYLKELVALDTGAILISAHIGNSEMAAQLFKRIDKKVNVIMLDKEYEKIKNYLSSEVYGNKNFNIIALSEETDHTYEIVNALNNKEIICMHGDRYIEGNRTTTVDFLGGKANFPIGPFALASALKVPVSFVFAMKDSSTHYHFYATPLKYYIAIDRKKHYEDLKNHVQEYASILGNMVKKYPTQWFNYYNFWKK